MNKLLASIPWTYAVVVINVIGVICIEERRYEKSRKKTIDQSESKSIEQKLRTS